MKVNTQDNIRKQWGENALLIEPQGVGGWKAYRVSFIGYVRLCFFNFQKALESHLKLCLSELDFFKNNSVSQNCRNLAKNRLFLNLLKNLVIKFFWIWSPIKIYIICYINEKSSYLTTEFHKSPFKNLGPEIWAKIPLANQMAGVWNQQSLWRK